MEEIARFLKEAYKLKEIKRKGWERIGIRDAESVASHSYMVALIAMLIGDELKLNVEKLMKMALLHDIGEAIIGDITPYEMSKEEKLEKEKKAVKELCSMLGNEYYEMWLEFAYGKSNEAKLLQEIDKIDMILQAKEYGKKYGMEKLKEFLKNEIENELLKELISSFDKINDSSNNKI